MNIILKHVESINKPLEVINRPALIISTADKKNLSKVTEVMQYFSRDH